MSDDGVGWIRGRGRSSSSYSRKFQKESGIFSFLYQENSSTWEREFHHLPGHLSDKEFYLTLHVEHLSHTLPLWRGKTEEAASQEMHLLDQILRSSQPTAGCRKFMPISIWQNGGRVSKKHLELAPLTCDPCLYKLRGIEGLRYIAGK